MGTAKAKCLLSEGSVVVVSGNFNGIMIWIGAGAGMSNMGGGGGNGIGGGGNSIGGGGNDSGGGGIALGGGGTIGNGMAN